MPAPKINMLAIQSRLRVGVTGPEFFGYKTSGVIKAEFLGVANDLYLVNTIFNV